MRAAAAVKFLKSHKSKPPTEQGPHHLFPVITPPHFGNDVDNSRQSGTRQFHQSHADNGGQGLFRAIIDNFLRITQSHTHIRIPLSAIVLRGQQLVHRTIARRKSTEHPIIFRRFILRKQWDFTSASPRRGGGHPVPPAAAPRGKIRLKMIYHCRIILG